MFKEGFHNSFFGFEVGEALRKGKKRGEGRRKGKGGRGGE